MCVIVCEKERGRVALHLFLLLTPIRRYTDVAPLIIVIIISGGGEDMMHDGAMIDEGMMIKGLLICFFFKRGPPPFIINIFQAKPFW